MKKYFLISLTLLAGMLAFTACHSEAMESVSSAKGDLNLSSMKAEVNTNVDTVYVGSRAESTVEQDDRFPDRVSVESGRSSIYAG